MKDLYLANWCDVFGDSKRDEYIDYVALLASDDEFLCLESLLSDSDTFEAGLDEYQNQTAH